MGEIINQRWISVEDRLPEIGREVLVFGKAKDPDLYNNSIHITRMDDRNIFNSYLKVDPYWISPYQYYFENYTITHWMPIPPSPNDIGSGCWLKCSDCCNYDWSIEVSK